MSPCLKIWWQNMSQKASFYLLFTRVAILRRENVLFDVATGKRRILYFWHTILVSLNDNDFIIQVYWKLKTFEILLSQYDRAMNTCTISFMLCWLQYVPYSYHVDLIFVWYFLNGVIICLIDKAFSHHEQWKHFNRLRPPWALNPTINIHISSSA